MENKNSPEKSRQAVLLVCGLLLYMLITLAVVRVYRMETVTQLQKQILQNATYIVMLLLSLGLMKSAKKPFSRFGLSAAHMGRQLLVGIAAGAGLKAVLLLFGSIPAVPENVLYVVLSQALVAFSEETFWRGYVLDTALELTGTKDRAVFISSLLFGLSHYPIGHSIAQVIVTFIIGALFAVLRTEFGNTVKIPALAVGHALNNIF